MAVDSAAHISALDIAKPDGGVDPAAELDNNIRHIKTVLKTDFAAIAGAVTASHTELNYTVGLTSSAQTQINTKGAHAGQTWTGPHNYTGATVTVATKSGSYNGTEAANGAMVQAAVAAVNSATGNLVRTTNSSASITITAGQMVASTYTGGAVAVTWPTPSSVGEACGVSFDNGRTDNTVDFGAYSVIGSNGLTVTGVTTIDTTLPVVLAWYGDYWRGA